MNDGSIESQLENRDPYLCFFLALLGGISSHGIGWLGLSCLNQKVMADVVTGGAGLVS